MVNPDSRIDRIVHALDELHTDISNVLDDLPMSDPRYLPLVATRRAANRGINAIQAGTRGVPL